MRKPGAPRRCNVLRRTDLGGAERIGVRRTALCDAPRAAARRMSAKVCDVTFVLRVQSALGHPLPRGASEDALGDNLIVSSEWGAV